MTARDAANQLERHVGEVAAVLARHRINYSNRNIGGETASTLRYTSCEGCDWLGGWHDEAGWEAHLAQALLAPGGVVAGIVGEALREAADLLVAECSSTSAPCFCSSAHWLRDRAAMTEGG